MQFELLLSDEQAAFPGCTPPLPWDSWDKLQHPRDSECWISGGRKWKHGWTDGWMDGVVTVAQQLLCFLRHKQMFWLDRLSALQNMWLQFLSWICLQMGSTELNKPNSTATSIFPPVFQDIKKEQCLKSFAYVHQRQGGWRLRIIWGDGRTDELRNNMSAALDRLSDQVTVCSWRTGFSDSSSGRFHSNHQHSPSLVLSHDSPSLFKVTQSTFQKCTRDGQEGTILK